MSSLGGDLRDARRAARAPSPLGTAVQYHVHRRVELPPGATVARMPGPLEVKATLVDASRELTVWAAAGRRARCAIEDDFVLDVVDRHHPARGSTTPSSGAAHAADDGFLAAARVAMP